MTFRKLSKAEIHSTVSTDYREILKTNHIRWMQSDQDLLYWHMYGKTFLLSGSTYSCISIQLINAISRLSNPLARGGLYYI